MPLWYAIVRFLGEQEIVADFFFQTPGDACTSMTSHRVRAVCPYTSGSRYYLLLAGCDSSVLFYNIKGTELGKSINLVPFFYVLLAHNKTNV